LAGKYIEVQNKTQIFFFISNIFKMPKKSKTYQKEPKKRKFLSIIKARNQLKHKNVSKFEREIEKIKMETEINFMNSNCHTIQEKEICDESLQIEISKLKNELINNLFEVNQQIIDLSKFKKSKNLCKKRQKKYLILLNK